MRARHDRTRRGATTAGLLGLLFLVGAHPLASQGQPTLAIEREDGSTDRADVRMDRGFAAIPVSVLRELGWGVRADGTGLTITAADEITIDLRLESPFFRWDGVVLQFADAPYRAGSETYVPLQFVTDFLPRRLPGLYDYSASRSVLRAGDLALLRGEPVGATPPRPPSRQRAGDGSGDTAEEVRAAGPSLYDGVRVVVIDPGHGGDDPGALGPEGVREKAVALGIARELARRLRAVPELEVHMIRDDDTFVDLWERGLIATDLKGERPGIFVSIHANSFPARRSARGFETYFLSDARTEHERRVSAIENAPLSMNPNNVDDTQLADLDFILRDLRNYDHAHWSENLATLVQDELDDVHPGPNRGVKQGVLAVLTNALMPAVLVEVGYLSNDQEARLLSTEAFHQNAADAIAEAVVRFFERYPPGNGIGGAREQP